MPNKSLSPRVYLQTLQHLIPELVDQPGPCVGHSYMGMHALLTLQVSKFIEHVDAVYYGIPKSKTSDQKITLDDLYELIAAEQLPIDYREIGDPESDSVPPSHEKMQLEEKTNNVTVIDEKQQDEKKVEEAQDLQLYTLLEKLGLQDIVQVFKEETKRNNEKRKNQKEASPAINASELKQQIDLACKIREAVLKKAKTDYKKIKRDLNGVPNKKLFLQNKLQTFITKYPYIQCLLDLETFVGNTGLYQTPESYQIFSKKQMTNNAASVMPLIAPAMLVDHEKIGIHNLYEKTRNYNVKKLNDTLASLAVQINKHFADFSSNEETWSGELPFALVMSADYHVITIGYNIKKQQWIIIDSNGLPIAYENQNQIAHNLLNQFAVCDEQYSFFTDSGFACLKYLKKVDKWVLSEMKADNLNPQESDCARVIQAVKNDQGKLINHLNDATFSIKTIVYANNNVRTKVAALLSEWQTSLPDVHEIKMGDYYNLDTLSERSLFYWACYENDIATVDAIASKVSLDYLEKTNSNGFLIAAARGNLAVIQCLLDNYHVNVNLVNSFHETALHTAAYYGYSEVVEFLLKQKMIDPNLEMGDGKTPLACAIVSDHVDVARLLLSNNVRSDIKEGSSIKDSSLYSLCKSAAMRRLLEDYRTNMLNTSTNTPGNLFKSNNADVELAKPIENKTNKRPRLG